MDNQPFELDWSRYYENNHHHTLLAIITGADIEDITKASCTKHRWRGRDYISAFNSLGYSTNKRFIPFDPHTPHPCIMRSVEKIKEEGKGWYSSVYYQDHVYEGNSMIQFDDYLETHPSIRVTSMLQVWI